MRILERCGEWSRRLWSLFTPRAQFDLDLQEEMRLHRELRARSLEEAGAGPEESRSAAQRKFGNLLRLQEEIHQAWGWNWIDNLGRDLKYAWRRLRNSPGFTTVAVLTLALGIGANTAIFTLIEQVMFNPLPVERPEELYSLGDDKIGCCWGGLVGDFSVYSYPLYLYLRDHTPEFSEVAAFSSGDEVLGVRPNGAQNAIEPFRGESVSGNYFHMLGVRASAGRLLEPEDDQPNAPPVVVMSYRAWRDKFAADRALVGGTLVIKGLPVTVVGITPPEFFGETLRSDPPAIFMPLSMEATLHPEASLVKHWNEYWLFAIGRLRPGIQPAQVQVRVSAELRQWLSDNYVADRYSSDPYIAGRYIKEIPKQHIVVMPAARGVATLRDENKGALALLMALSSLVLLLACSNIANLLLARTTSSRRQTAVRLALGASRARILLATMTEGLLLALLGGAAGLWMSVATTRGILLLAFPDAQYVPIYTAPSPAVLGFAFAISLLTGLIFSAGPAWMSARTEAANPMRGAGRSASDPSLLPHKSLVVLQTVVSLVLLVGAGLLAVSLRQLKTQKASGVETEGRLMAWVSLPRNQFPSQRLASFYQQLAQQLAEIPGVLSSSFSNSAPISGGTMLEPISIQGKPPVPSIANGKWPGENRVSAHYFETIGTRLLHGRVIDERDTATSRHVAVIDQAFARFFFPGEDPLGKHFGVQTVQHARDYEIVGIVQDAQYRDPRMASYPTFFLPLLQEEKYVDTAEDLEQFDSRYITSIQLRVAGRPEAFARPLGQALAAIDRNVSFVRTRTFREQIGRNFDQEHLVVWLTAVYGLLALLLASIGLYGVASYSAARRTKEIGIRMALGADRPNVLALIMRGGMRPIALGLAIGIPAALAVGRLIAGRLYGVKSYDPLIFASASLALVMSAMIAAYFPARRAASIEPMRALRSE